MKEILIVLLSIPILLVGLTTSKSSYPNSLDEIALFAERICNDVRTEGEISRFEIEGKLEGNSELIATLLTTKIKGDVSLKQKKDVFNNLPLEELSEQFSDARACKKELAKLLLKERSNNELNPISVDTEAITKPWYKRWQVWVGVLVVGAVISACSDGGEGGSSGAGGSGGGC